ncbi:hypothetical protein NUW58_g494 [Xylaria curta]|uniref:Uncharacterized protein n=1 Tax=Xylaria curta TaxID=42375 RepID=A0ACC1PQ64_9PEZI|nr:hypothetical protein NUW58_g494 [Xylaria curta]
MYGVIAFGKGKEPHFTEFCVAAGKRRRGSACKGCRIARVKCSGKLDGSACTRCKRLSVACLYTGNNSSRRSRSSSNTPAENNVERTGITPPTTPKSTSPSNPPMSFSQLNLAHWNNSGAVTDDPLNTDFDMCLRQQIGPSMVELPQSHTDSFILSSPSDPFSLTAPPSSLCSAPSQSENLERDSGPYEASVPRSSGQCKCLQVMTSSLSSLRSWKWTGFPTGSGDGATGNIGIVENFLTLFEQSTTSLEAVENCPLACMLSEDLSVILLFVVELLADLLAGLLKGDVCEPHPPNTNQLPAQTTKDSSPARIGSFDIKDPLDVRMVLNLLLQIRAQSVSAYISRWGDRIKEFRFRHSQGDLQRIHQTLSTVTHPNNTRDPSGAMADDGIFGFNSQWLPDLLPESLFHA